MKRAPGAMTSTAMSSGFDSNQRPKNKTVPSRHAPVGTRCQPTSDGEVFGLLELFCSSIRVSMCHPSCHPFSCGKFIAINPSLLRDNSPDRSLETYRLVQPQPSICIYDWIILDPSPPYEGLGSRLGPPLGPPASRCSRPPSVPTIRSHGLSRDVDLDA